MQGLITKISRSKLNPNPLVEHILNQQVTYDQRQYYLTWGIINSVIALPLIYDVSTTCQKFKDTKIYKIEYTLMIFVFISALTCFTKFFWLLLRQKRVFGTEEQKWLLSSEKDNSFKTIQKNENKASDLGDDIDDIYEAIDWHSSLQKDVWNPLPGRHTPSPTRGSPNNSCCTSPKSANNTITTNNMNSSEYVSPYTELSGDNYLWDMPQTIPYMRNIDQEQNFLDSIDMPHCGVNPANSFWNYYSNGAAMLKTNAYQMSPPPLPTAESSPVVEDANSHQFRNSNSEVIKGIPTDKLSQYLANLRYWMSETILQRVVKEINNVDEALRQCGILDIKVGAVSLERLRKTAEYHHLVQTCVPMLPMLLTFLDTFNNQEYLVQRIKELSQSSCIADYRWNSGNSHNGREWDEHLPTDAAILFHLFCVYLDRQLMPLPQGGGRPFHSRYVLTHDEKRSPKFIVDAVNNKAHCAILTTSNQLNPRFNFISEKEVHNCAHDRNNLFYVIIQFLIYMKKHQDSTLEGVFLGQSGINIMCVIED